MRRLALLSALALFVLAATGSALAFDCSSAVPLACNGPALSGTIGIPPETNFVQCGGGANYKHKLYTLTLTSPQTIDITVTSGISGIIELVVFGGCDENACLATSPLGTSQITGLCLPAGTYTVALYYLVEVVTGYTISATCQSCTPVAADATEFGAIKALYR